MLIDAVVISHNEDRTYSMKVLDNGAEKYLYIREEDVDNVQTETENEVNERTKADGAEAIEETPSNCSCNKCYKQFMQKRFNKIVATYRAELKKKAKEDRETIDELNDRVYALENCLARNVNKVIELEHALEEKDKSKSQRTTSVFKLVEKEEEKEEWKASEGEEASKQQRN